MWYLHTIYSDFLQFKINYVSLAICFYGISVLFTNHLCVVLTICAYGSNGCLNAMLKFTCEWQSYNVAIVYS